MRPEHSGLPRPPRQPWIARLYSKLLHLLHQRTIVVLVVLFCLGGAIGFWNMVSLYTNLIHNQALQNAQLYAQAIQEARTLYSGQVVDRMQNLPAVSVSADYTKHTGGIPLPATFLIELSQQISQKNPGMSVRLYSDYPFTNRQSTGGPHDEFEATALQMLRQQPKQPFVRFESFQGRPALRYAQADIMKPSCVACHNHHPDSTKRDWKVGDVRGVLEITTPLDSFETDTKVGLSSTFVMFSTLSVLGVMGIATVISRLRQTSEELELRVIERTSELRETNQKLAQEQQKSERLLLNILPEPIADRLKEGDSVADGFTSVSILFADLVNFTQLSEQVPPRKLVEMLNEIFSSFDELTEKYGLEKIKTIGDAYMVAGGLPNPHEDHATAIAEMALAMRKEIDTFNLRHEQNCNLRIGINTGPVVAGVIGTKKFIYDLWGDTVNVASRMESHGIPGQIQVTASTYECLRDRYTFESRGVIQVKGKGEVPAYLLTGRKTSEVALR